MITLYSGTPGSGKSLHLAEKIRMRLFRKRPVVGNFEISGELKNSDCFTYMDNQELTPDKLIQLSLDYFDGSRPVEGRLLLVIDECQLLFNSREWQQHGRADWLQFFTQHRKYGYDVILVAQYDGMVDKQIRSLIEYEYIHRKLTNFGARGWFLSLCMFSTKMFVAVEVWYPLKERIGSTFFRYHKKNAEIYDTFKDFSRKEE